MIPHEQKTQREQEAWAMRLAGILMRDHPEWKRFQDGFNCVGPSAVATREACRRADQAQWPQVRIGLADLLNKLEEAEDRDRRTEEIVQSGMWMHDSVARRLFPSWAAKQVARLRFVETGGVIRIFWWGSWEDSPFNSDGVFVYELIYKEMQKEWDPPAVESKRMDAQFVWVNMSDAQRELILTRKRFT